MRRVSRENSEDLGFVFDSLLSDAISKAELRRWADDVVIEMDEPPSFITDLALFEDDQPAFHVHKLVPFTPGWNATEEEEHALLGIAGLRGRGFPPGVHQAITRAEALEALRRNPQVLSRFRSTFPFIMLSTES